MFKSVVSGFLTGSVAIAGSALVMTAAPDAAFAFTLGAENVSNNGSTNVANNFSIDITEVGGQVKFTFKNTQNVSEASITAIYFGQEGTFENLLSFDSISQTFQTSTKSGVKFSSGLNTNTLGGDVKWDAVFAADAASPSGYNKYGIDVGEEITFFFDFVGTTTFSDIEKGFASGDLAVAFHAQSITGSGGYSDWFTNEGSDVTEDDVPEPFTILGTGAALGFSALFGKQQAKRKQRFDAE